MVYCRVICSHARLDGRATPRQLRHDGAFAASHLFVVSFEWGTRGKPTSTLLPRADAPRQTIGSVAQVDHSGGYLLVMTFYSEFWSSRVDHQVVQKDPKPSRIRNFSINIIFTLF